MPDLNSDTFRKNGNINVKKRVNNMTYPFWVNCFLRVISIFEVLHIGYQIILEGNFSYPIGDIGRNIGDTSSYWVIILNAIYTCQICKVDILMSSI